MVTTLEMKYNAQTIIQVIKDPVLYFVLYFVTV